MSTNESLLRETDPSNTDENLDGITFTAEDMVNLDETEQKTDQILIADWRSIIISTFLLWFEDMLEKVRALIFRGFLNQLRIKIMARYLQWLITLCSS